MKVRCSNPVFFLFSLFLSFFGSLSAQLVSGPMLGHVELRTAKIWVEVVPGSTTELWYWPQGQSGAAHMMKHASSSADWYSTHTFNLVDLQMNTIYEYAVKVNESNGKAPKQATGQFKTDELWQWRKPAPSFSFLTGSCAYINDPEYDRPGKPYGNDSSIFLKMADEKADFMIWLGDNWYLREADYFSEWGIAYRAHHDRNLPVLQPFLKAMSHYAIWDDHDYGPNDADKSYSLKEKSTEVFRNYWGNPSYGFQGEGIYSKISKGDCDFLMMDDRTYRSNDDMSPFINGKPNSDKRMWGPRQMEWLKNSLLLSKAPFKFIVTGSQTLNPISPYDCLQDYPIEFQELQEFLKTEGIQGVVFLTGDRHHSEVIRFERPGQYPLYDITSSPLTAGVANAGGKEKDNPYRIAGTLVETQNFTRVSVSGSTGDRQLLVEFVDGKGQVLGQWKLNENELKNKK